MTKSKKPSRASRSAASRCSLCQWSTPRFAKNEMWCDANGMVVRPDWWCISFTKANKEITTKIKPVKENKHGS